MNDNTANPVELDEARAIHRANLITGSVSALRDLLCGLAPGHMLAAEPLGCLISLIAEAGEP